MKDFPKKDPDVDWLSDVINIDKIFSDVKWGKPAEAGKICTFCSRPARRYHQQSTGNLVYRCDVCSAF